MPVNLSYPKNREIQVKLAAVTFADTTARQIMALPKGAIIAGLYVIGATVSNAATTGTLGLGSTTAANEYMTGYDVKAAATGEGYNPAGAAAVGSALCTPLTADVAVYALYAETGAGATTGAWTILVEWYMPGGGETL